MTLAAAFFWVTEAALEMMVAASMAVVCCVLAAPVPVAAEVAEMDASAASLPWLLLDRLAGGRLCPGG